MRKKETTPACPKCGSWNSVPITYGYPDQNMLEASHTGEIELGGCVIVPNQPNRVCHSCHHRWRVTREGQGNPSTWRRN